MERKYNIYAALLVSACIVVIVLLNIKSFSWKSSSETIVDGSYASQVEDHFDDTLIIHEWSKNLWAALDYNFFKEGMQGVIVGKDGWLFTNEEFYVNNNHSQLTQHFSFIQKVKDVLTDHNIDLKIVLIPEKAELYSEFAPKQTNRGSTLRGEVTEFLDGINQPYVDLFPLFLEQKQSIPLFLRTDTHWSPHGAKIAAKEVSKTLLDKGNETFSTKHIESINFRGDLLNFVPVSPNFTLFGPNEESLDIFVTEPVSGNGIDDSLDDGDFSFDISNPELLLIGTSYSANNNWNFPGFLKEAASQDLIDLSTEGDGPFHPMQEFIGSPDYFDGTLSTVLWEIPVRYFQTEIEKNDHIKEDNS